MGTNTNIQWTDDSDNPVVARGGGWYCFKVSPGCQNCYAERLNQSDYFRGNHLPYKVLPDGSVPELELKRDMLAKWARIKTPRKHFVSSMTDVFGEFVPDEWVFEILDAMRSAPLQIFQVLTKRAERARLLTTEWVKAAGMERLPANIWLGVSVESQEWAGKRIPELLATPAAVRFLSVEPLLGPVGLYHYLATNSMYKADRWGSGQPKGQRNKDGSVTAWDKDGNKFEDGADLNWIIVGGESGPDARPFHLEWALNIIKECNRSRVACFVKQVGSNPYWHSEPLKLQDKKGGDIDEWPELLKVRQMPEMIMTRPFANTWRG